MKGVITKLKEITEGLGSSVEQTILVGGNEISLQLAERLAELGQNIIIIEKRKRLRKQIQERLDVLVLAGKGTNLEVLREAGGEEADLLIALTEDDQCNLLTGIYAQNLGIDQVIVQIKDKELFDRQLQVEKLGLDLVLNPFIMTVKRIRELIRPGVGPELDKILTNKVNISKFRVSHQSDFVYQTVQNLDLTKDTLLLAVLREGRAIIPQGNDKLYPGDVLYIISKRTLKGRLGQLIRYNSPRKNKIFLVGGDEINYQLAKHCQKQAIVTLIEEDKTRCKKIVEELSDILVLNGRGTDLNLLKEEGIGEADTFIASTEDDEANLLMANLAANLGVNSTAAVVSDISYSSLNDLLPVDYIISPALLAIDTILDYLHRRQVDQSAILAGQIKVSKIEINQKRRRSIKDLNLPPDMIIGLINRDDKIIIPAGETKLERGDQLVIFSLHNKREIENHF